MNFGTASWKADQCDIHIPSQALEIGLINRVVADDDYQEGLRAFFDKREAKFIGR
ncbi:MAG TPA: hypothetical protein PLB95_12530 [Syntrophales bacterium]|jgi:hypothetical protein|nr:hypothetical protein [Syntrophales bacterium]